MNLDLDQQLLDASSTNTDPDTVESLIMLGANPNARHSTTGKTPLMYACKSGHIEIVNVLLKYGDITATDINKRTPLHHASTPEIADLLLVYPYVKIDVIDREGFTPLALAVKNQSRLMVAFYIDHGANIDQKMGFNMIMHIAIKYYDDVILEELITAGAKVDARNSKMFTPLHFAAVSGNTSAIKLLLKYGADIEATTDKWYTPLHKASIHPKAVKLLLKHGADVHARSSSLETPLYLATTSTESVKLLLDAGADPNAEDSRRCTPLHKAVCYDCIDTVRILLDRRAILRLNLRNKSPLDKAVALDRKEILEVLKIHLANRKRKREMLEANR
jgi:ankyrin repeat protein